MPAPTRAELQECPGCYTTARKCKCDYGPELPTPRGKHWDQCEVPNPEDPNDYSRHYWYIADNDPCSKCGRETYDADHVWLCGDCDQWQVKCTCDPVTRPGGSWNPVDLAAIVEGGCEDEAPYMLKRTDGALLMYRRKMHTFSGESESLKTWLVLICCAEVISDGGRVLYIDYEDSAAGIAGRLLALGCPAQDIIQRFCYVRPDEPYSVMAAAVLAVRGYVDLSVIDGVTEAMSSHGLDPNINADVAVFYAKLPKPLAAAGAAVAMIDHVTKSRESRGRWAIGGQHKLAAVDGAAYIVELIKPFGHGMHGIAKIIVAKDRPGRVREHCHDGVAGLMHLRSEPDGSVLAEIRPGREFSGEETTEFRPTVLMDRVSRVVEAKPGLTKTAILTTAKGKTDHKKLALELLIREGYIAEERTGQSLRYQSLKEYRDPGNQLQLTPDPESDPT